MQANVELIILPYSAEGDATIGHLLVKELSGGRWNRFQAAIAFAKQSGSYAELLDALRAFVADGRRAEITFGADVFGTDARGSDYEAIRTLLSQTGDDIHLFLYHEKGRTFHPKLYLFSNDENALLIVGSSNWSQGGFFSNIEANVLIDLDLTQMDHRECYEHIQRIFATYWQETQ